MDEKAFEQDLRAEGYEVLNKELTPDFSVDEHGHGWDVKGLVLAGIFNIETAEGKRAYGAGDCFVLAANVPHKETVGPEGAKLLVGRRHH